MNPVDPFNSRFEVFGREHRHRVESINRSAFRKLGEALDSGCGGDGRVILLRAPRAGYGKTSLLQRLSEDLAESHQFVRVNLTGGRTTDSAHVLEYVLQALCEVLPGSTTLTWLDILARRVFALGLEPLVNSGEVPCQDPEGALAALRENPAETFDFHHDRAVTAHWTKSNFEILGPRLAAELSRQSGASLREASYWVELLFRFATTPPDNVERARLLFETIFRSDLQSQSTSATEERLHGLLSLCGTVTNPVLIVDDTEGLSTSPSDALALASFLSNISQSCPGTAIILSVNDDIWESAFLPLLPGGLADRLLEHGVTLDPLTRQEAEALVSARAGERASEVIAAMDWASGGEDLYSRQVLQFASDAWDALGSQPSEVMAPSPEPASGTRMPAPDDAPGLDADDPLAELPEFEEIPPQREVEPKDAHRTPATGSREKEQPASSPGQWREPIFPVEPAIASPVEAPLASDDTTERAGPRPGEQSLAVPGEQTQGPERETEEHPSVTPANHIEPKPVRDPAPEDRHPGAPEEILAPADAPREILPVTAPGVFAPDPPRKEESSFPMTSAPEPPGEPPATQPLSPFVAVSPAEVTGDLQPPLQAADLESDPDSSPATDLEGGQFPVEAVYPFSGAEDSSCPGPVAPDPTGGEIEFAKLKPLAEEPPAGGPTPSITATATPANDSEPIAAQPEAAAIHESPFTAVPPGSSSPAPARVGGSFDAVPPASDTDSVDQAEPDAPFAAVTPQAATPSASPFAEVKPPANAVPHEQASRTPKIDETPTPPAQPSPFEPGASPSAPSSWWPGDAPATAGGSGDDSSPFAAVGSPPPEAAPQAIPEPTVRTSSGEAAPTDKEEVDKLLRKLREGQDQG